MSPRRLYMDNAATSFPKPPAVLEAMTHYATQLGASAGRGAYQEAIDTAGLLSDCRRKLCALFNGQRPEHFIFTLNCTDGLNLAIKGLIESGEANHAICTHIDHNSILRPINALCSAGMLRATKIPIDPQTGLVDPDDIRRAIEPATRFIAITHVSNVTGTIQPIDRIGAIAAEAGIPFIIDAAQSAGHVPIDVGTQHIDLLAAPGHKGLLGPLGTGFLYIRPGLEHRLRSLKEGGTGSVSESETQPDFMPDKFESGSHNAIGIAGLGAGVDWIAHRTVARLAADDLDLVRAFYDGIDGVDGLTVYGPKGIKNRVGVFSVNIDGLEPYELAGILESQYGILTRPGLHCAPLAHRAIGSTERGGTVRLSFGPFLTPQDVSFACDALADIALSRLATKR